MYVCHYLLLPGLVEEEEKERKHRLQQQHHQQQQQQSSEASSNSNTNGPPQKSMAELYGADKDYPEPYPAGRIPGAFLCTE
jgi:hypothetical protein